MDNIFDNKILIDEVLNDNGFEKTEKIYISLPEGSRKGPFIKKSFSKNSGLGNSYQQIFDYVKFNKQHKNIPAIYSVKQDNNANFIIEEYIDGLTLDLFLKENIYSKRIIDSIFKQLCNVVSWLHETMKPSIIHRDIKPQNIMVVNSNNNIEVKLIDFGISRNINETSGKDTKVFGTVGFAPPEQFGFKQTDKRSDIYSIGKVLLYMIDSKNWSNKENKDNIKVYDGIIKKCTEFDPDNRYKNINELWNDFSSPSKVNFKLNNSKLFKIFSIFWNVFITCFLLLSMTICTFVVLLPDPGSSMGDLSSAQKLLFNFIVNVFILIPIWYLLLFKNVIKNKIKWFPKTNLIQNVILILVCLFLVLFLSLIAIYLF